MRQAQEVQETKPSQERVLEIVLKISERCNLKCTYCYFFFGGDESYRSHPATITDAALSDIASFLRREIELHRFSQVSITLHGGEPLLLKKSRVRHILNVMTEATSGSNVYFWLTTSGLLVDDEWVDIFDEFNVLVAVSLDGPKHINDKYRLDRRGAGTYDRAAEGFRILREAELNQRLRRVSVLCVIDPEEDGGQIYNHLVHDLGAARVDFLFPDVSHETFPHKHSGKYGAYVKSVARAWFADNDPEIHVRVLSQYLERLCATPEQRAEARRKEVDGLGITVTSDGQVGLDDSLRIISPTYLNFQPIAESSFVNLFGSETKKIVDEATAALPTACRGCMWADICRGGQHILHRYSAERGFDNPSVYCQDLKILFGELAGTLAGKSPMREQLIRNLSPELHPAA